VRKGMAYEAYLSAKACITPTKPTLMIRTNNGSTASWKLSGQGKGAESI